jgi:hypothetical protein
MLVISRLPLRRPCALRPDQQFQAVELVLARGRVGADEGRQRLGRRAIEEGPYDVSERRHAGAFAWRAGRGSIAPMAAPPRAPAE